MLFFRLLFFFFQINFFKTPSECLDQKGHSVGPDLVPNNLQRQKWPLVFRKESKCRDFFNNFGKGTWEN